MNRRSAITMLGVGALSTLGRPPISRAETPRGETLLFNGDFETGSIAQYNEIETSGGNILPRVTTAVTRSSDSRYAGVYSLSGKQYRCESIPAYRNAPYVAIEGSDLFYGWSIYFPEDFPRAPWQACGQWHQTYMEGKGKFDDVSPPMAFYVASEAERGGRWSLSNNGLNPWQKGWSLDLGKVPRGEWADVVVHAKFSVDPTQCLVEVWLNGVESGKLVPPVPTLYPTEGESTRTSYFKVGYYRDRSVTVPGTVIFDNVRIGRDHGSVAL